MDIRYYNMRLACIGMFVALSLGAREPLPWSGPVFAFVFMACWILDGFIDHVKTKEK